MKIDINSNLILSYTNSQVSSRLYSCLRGWPGAGNFDFAAAPLHCTEEEVMCILTFLWLWLRAPDIFLFAHVLIQRYLGVIAVKRASELESHYRMLFSFIPRTLFFFCFVFVRGKRKRILSLYRGLSRRILDSADKVGFCNVLPPIFCISDWT